jgi:hypothetical protein
MQSYDSHWTEPPAAFESKSNPVLSSSWCDEPEISGLPIGLRVCRTGVMEAMDAAVRAAVGVGLTGTQVALQPQVCAGD